MIRKIVNFNKKISRILGKLRLQKGNIYSYYEETVIKHMKSNQTIVDVGGGKKSFVTEHKKQYENSKVIAVDISDDELAFNDEVDEKIVADVTKEIPISDASVDMIISRSVLEHLVDQDKFFENANRVLRKNGESYFIHIFPSKFSLFAIVNQLLPKSISNRLLGAIFPESKKTNGFPAYYNKCYYSAMKKMLIENEFEIEEFECNYYQSAYFGFFFPLYFLSLLWDNFCYIFKIKNLCSYICIVAKK